MCSISMVRYYIFEHCLAINQYKLLSQTIKEDPEMKKIVLDKNFQTSQKQRKMTFYNGG